MSLHGDLPPIPPRDASAEVFAAYWLSVSEMEYQSRNYEAAAAGAAISRAWYERAAFETPERVEVLAVDYLGQRGPTGEQRRADLESRL